MGIVLWLLAVFSLPFIYVWVSNAIELRRRPLEDLVDREDTIPWNYFKPIEAFCPEVKEYVALVKARDYKAIYDNWARFEKAFLDAERQAGHTGRPFIFDYYFTHKRSLREYLRRGT